jgi:hypothetical protein
MNYYFCNTQGQIERLTIVEKFTTNIVKLNNIPPPAPQYVDQTGVNVNQISPYATQTPSTVSVQPTPQAVNQLTPPNNQQTSGGN